MTLPQVYDEVVTQSRDRSGARELATACAHGDVHVVEITDLSLIEHVRQVPAVRPPVVIIPIEGWNRVAERAVRFALLLSDDITAVHVSTEHDDTQRLRALWTAQVEQPAQAAQVAVPRLEIIYSPYRQLYEPIVEFVKKTTHRRPDRLIAVIIPELVEPHWYEYVLHNQHGAGLKARLYREGDPHIVVINTPWYVREG
jgi:hypothetical protein